MAGLALGWAWFAVCAIAFGGRLLRFGAPAEAAGGRAGSPAPGALPLTAVAGLGMARVIAFDVNETLLDLGALDPLFERAFGRAAARPVVRADAPARVRRRADRPLRGLHQRAARRAGDARGDVRRAARTDDEEEILGAMRRLPPHADAGPRARPPARRRPHARRAHQLAAGRRPRPARRRRARGPLPRDPLRRPGAGAEAAARAVPPRRPHLSTCRSAEVRLVAAHAWDVSGALAAGCAAAFVRRPGKVPSPLGPQPDIIGDGLLEVAERIVAADAPARR